MVFRHEGTTSERVTANFAIDANIAKKPESRREPSDELPVITDG
jgi:hypothetical protein